MTDYSINDTIYSMFTTRAFATGVPTVLSGSPVVSAYENDGTAQITAGITLGISHDGVAGMNLLTINATTGNGFEIGKDYNLIISTGTVGGVSVVGEVVGSFSIERSAAVADIAGLNDIAATDIVSAGAITTLSGAVVNVDTLDDKTGYSLSATGLDLIASTAIGVVAIAKAAWDRILTGGTHNINNSAGKRLRGVSGTILDDGTAQAGTADTITLVSGSNTNNGFFNGTTIQLSAGAGVGQSRIISDYDGTTKIAVITPAWITTPDSSTDYNITPGSVHSSTMNGGYLDGNVWLNTNSGTAGTLKYVNGTSTRPSLTLADARTLADLLNLSAIYFSAGSSETLSQSFDQFIFNGRGYSIAFAGQSAVTGRFNNGLYSGIIGGATGPLFRDCFLTNITAPPNTTAITSDLATVYTLSGTGVWSFIRCTQGTATPPALNYSASGDQTVRMLDFNGEIEIQNLGNTGTDILIITGRGKVTFNANCTGGTVRWYGNMTKINNGSGITFEEIGRVDNDTINGECDTAITDAGIVALLDDIQGTTFNTSTDSLRAIRDRGDAAWITGGGGAGLTQQNVRDAMKLTPTAGVPATGSVDEHLDEINVDTGTSIPATLTTIEAKIDTVDTVVDGIQADLSNGTDGLGAIKISVDAIPTTAMRGTDGANTTAPDNSTIAAIKVDTAAIRVDTDATIPASLATIESKIDVVDINVDAVKVKTDKLTFTSGNDLDANIKKVNSVTVTGTGSSGDEWGP